MRIGIIETGHWHCGSYVSGLRETDEEIAAVSDGNPDVARRWGEECSCEAYTDHAQMLEKAELDFVFAFGRHCDMPDIVRLLIEAEIPFCVEKPVGIRWDEVRELARMAEGKHLFNAVPFAWRQSEPVRKMVSVTPPGDFTHLHFRCVTGSPQRYVKAGCEWMLHREQAGGGCMINLGVHYVDLFRYLTRENIRKVSAATSSKTHNKDIEDFAAAIMESENGSVGVVEVGYTFPGDGADQYFSLSTTDNYFVIRDKRMERTGRDGKTETFHFTGPRYQDFVVDVLDRFRNGHPPAATLRDACEALRVVTRIYDAAKA